MSNRARTLEAYYSASYPPSVLVPPTPATGATAGIPGTWTPTGAQAPADVAALQGASPPIAATPGTAWTVGQYVQTRASGAAGRAYWSGTAWVAGAAPVVGADPATSTVEQVKTYVEGLGDPADPEVQAEVQRILDAERAGQNRSTLVSWLDQRLGIEAL